MGRPPDADRRPSPTSLVPGHHARWSPADREPDHAESRESPAELWRSCGTRAGVRGNAAAEFIRSCRREIGQSEGCETGTREASAEPERAALFAVDVAKPLVEEPSVLSPTVEDEAVFRAYRLVQARQ